MIHFKIYQADKSSPTGLKILFQPYETLQNENIVLSLDDYKKVYEGDFEEDTDSKLSVTEQLYIMFNISRPKNFKGHSLSVSDIIVIDGQQYFCDNYGFKAVSVAVTELKNNEDSRKLQDNTLRLWLLQDTTTNQLIWFLPLMAQLI